MSDNGSASPILADDFKLSLLCYAHSGPLIRSLRGKFDPTQMDTAIQLGELSCGCWAVLDGNNRIAMIMENNPTATVEVSPRINFFYLNALSGTETIWSGGAQTRRRSILFASTRLSSTKPKGESVNSSQRP